MNTVYFDEYNSWEDFHLILSEKKIESPAYKSETTDIPGGDGVLDHTEYFGEVKFKNRKLTFTFTTFGSQYDLAEILSRVQNAIQGRKVKITLSNDSDFYYIGRVKIKTPTNDKNIMKIPMECDCEPYKYKVFETVIKKTINGEVRISCPNLRKTVVPTIVTDGEIKITFDGATYSLSAGTYLLPEIYFTEGTNILTIEGTATIEIRYREGGL